MTAQKAPQGHDEHAGGRAAHHRRPSRKPFWRKVTLVVAGFAVGVLGMAGFVTGVEWTNRTEFCISCHSMVTNYNEYKASVHYSNRTGAHAQCADCHVPKALGPKLVRKIFAVNDIIAEIRGTIDTTPKFEAKRLELAERVWAYMKDSDSRECRSCHAYESMNLAKQTVVAKGKHSDAAMAGKTCIDCHRGVAHKVPYVDDD